VERDRALWHPSGQFVAIADQGFRHSTECHVYGVFGKQVELLPLPDYVQNALGRVNSVAVDFACVSTPKRWDGDDLVVDLYFTANQRHSYRYEVILHLRHDDANAPSISLKSVSPPNETEE
jgi:hypothetical protein